MTGGLTILSALLMGLAASGHCLVMCGGITAALGVATARDERGRPRPLLLVGYQAGRVISYVVVALLLGGLLGGIVALLDVEWVRRTFRVFAAVALFVAALVALGRLRDPLAFAGRRLWPRLSSWARKLLPVRTLPRALAFGMIWGWMPCGFVYTVLLVATLQLNAWSAAATMAAFGLGTVPAMLGASFGAKRLMDVTSSGAGRRIAGAVLLASAALTLAGPWVIGWIPWAHAWLPYDCVAVR
ncbi:MAG: sulfite exporter TauE/SafE family protein [Rhodanobacteraceae bacterium]